MAKNLTASEAAKAIGVTLPRIYHLIELGRLPADKSGKLYMIDPADLAKVKPRPRSPKSPKPAGRK